MRGDDSKAHRSQTRVERGPGRHRGGRGRHHHCYVGLPAFSKDDFRAVRAVAVSHQPVVQQPVDSAGNSHRIRIGGPCRRDNRVERVQMLLIRAVFVGEHAKAMVYSVTEGEDKPLKYPVMRQRSSR